MRALGIDVVADLRGVGRNLQNHPLAFHRRAFAARRAPAESVAAASDDLPALFLRTAGSAAERHVYRRAQQVVVERARRANRQFLCHHLQAGLARLRDARVGGGGAPPRIEFNFPGEEIDLSG